MLKELEAKRKKHKEILDMGYPRGLSPSKHEMIKELIAPKYEDAL